MGREPRRIKRVAIACQGGGSHSAFTAGALKRLLAEDRERYEVVALSGTSGGAICALLVWYALLKNDRGEAVRLGQPFGADELSLGDLVAEERRGGERLPVGEPALGERAVDRASRVEDSAVRVAKGAALDPGLHVS